LDAAIEATGKDGAVTDWLAATAPWHSYDSRSVAAYVRSEGFNRELEDIFA
jgi:hypothetical protein